MTDGKTGANDLIKIYKSHKDFHTRIIFANRKTTVDTENYTKEEDLKYI